MISKMKATVGGLLFLIGFLKLLKKGLRINVGATIRNYKTVLTTNSTRLLSLLNKK